MKYSIAGLVKMLFIERRLPGIVTNSRLFGVFYWLLFRFKLRNAVPELKGGESGCIVFLPVYRGRYDYTAIWWILQLYDKVMISWSPSPSELSRLFAEGRLLLKLRNRPFISEKDLRRQDVREWDLAYSGGCPPAEFQRRHLLEFRLDLSERPLSKSFVLPYTCHPGNFSCDVRDAKRSVRPIRVFFSGVLGFYGDDRLVRRMFGVPSRDEAVRALGESDLEIEWVESVRERKRVVRAIQDGESYSLIISSVKGDPASWYDELQCASFFLCFPGSHMLMCHNSVEAMLNGCIPILSYPDWFCPSLEDGKNCLVYRNEVQLEKLLQKALQISEAEIERMRDLVIQYAREHLNPERVSERVRGFLSRGELNYLYLNHEDVETLARASEDSALKTSFAYVP